MSGYCAAYHVPTDLNPGLEDQLCALTLAGYHGAGSPDRADAMVWAMTELFEKERAAPRVRGF